MNRSGTGRPVALLVDDDADFLSALAITAWDIGYESVTAPNGREAFKLLETRDKVDVIVSDWMMSTWDGVQFLSKVRESHHRETPFVLISGAVTKNDLVAAIGFDTDSVLLKPFSAEQLKQAIVDATTRRRAKLVKAGVPKQT